jgi:anti-anti-sigma factor
VLGEAPGIGGWHSVTEYPDARQRPGIVVFRWEAPMFFANAGQLREQVRALVRDQRPGWVVLQCEAVTDIDVTAAEVLKDLDEELNAKGVHLAFVELRSRLQDLIERYGLHTTLDQEHFYPTLDEALADITTASSAGLGDDHDPSDGAP